MTTVKQNVKMNSEQLLKSMKLPTGTSVCVRHPYTQAIFEFDYLPTTTFTYLKQHSDCLESSFEYEEDKFVFGVKMTVVCQGEEKYYENF